MKIYLAGPMTGLPDLNFPAFHAEAKRLRALGHVVINPAEINPDPSSSWAECMRKDIPQLATCDTVALLDGWTASRGARLEHHIAFELGMQPRLATFFTEPAEYPTKRSAPAAPADAGLESFTEYFTKNYPGPSTLIADPMWHAPRIFAAAKRAITQATNGASA